MVSKKPTSHTSKAARTPAAKPAKASATKERVANTDADEEGKSGSLRPDEMPAEVLEFIQAIDEYKRIHRRPFPTWSEVLEVLKGLGYGRVS
jgi:hypothetical protein